MCLPGWYKTYVDSRWLYREVGARIKSRRRHLRWTQERLAQRLGLSRASLANIEIGRQKVLLHRLYHIAATLDVAIVDLLPLPRSRMESADDDIPLPDDLSATQRAQIGYVLREDIPIPGGNSDERSTHEQSS